MGDLSRALKINKARIKKDSNKLNLISNMARMFYISLDRQIWKIRQTDRKYIQTDKYVDI